MALVLLNAALAVFAICALLFMLYRQRKAHKQELVAVANVAATERDRQMAPFHVGRFTRAIEQCEKPDRLPELQRNLRYWQAVQAAEELRS